MPGPTTSPASAGCHRLIREYDATLVTSPAEMAALHPQGEASGGPSRSAEADAETVRVLDALSARSARTPDDIAARSGLSTGDVRRVLAVLELEGGAAERPDGGWVRRAARQ